MSEKKNHQPENWPLDLVQTRYVRGDFSHEDFEAALEFVLSDGGVPPWVFGGPIPSSVDPDLTKDDYNRGRPSYERANLPRGGKQ